MADAKSSLRIDLKKQIRALLQSVKRGCTSKQLYMDYQQVMGCGIPFEELGYSTFSQFIHDIPDVVEIRKNRDGSTTLHAVADQRTEHISHLVSKQKSTRAPYTQPPPARKPPPRSAPREFSAQLRQLFCCYPQGIPLANFNDAYARRFGRFLRFQPWGYSSLEQLLRDMDGVELVCNPLKGSTMVKPRRKNMSLKLDKKVPPEDSLNALETSPVREKSIEKCLREVKQKEPTPPIRPPIPDRLINNIRELLQAHPAGIWLSQFSAQYKEYYGEDLPVFTQGYSTPLHLLSSLPRVVSIERPHLGNGDWLVAEVGAIVKVAPNHVFLSSAYISDELTATIHRILAPAPEGIMLNSLLRTYKEKTGKELEIRELGFNTLVQLLERVDGVAVMKPPDAGFMMVYGPKRKGRKGGGGESCGGSSCGSETEEAPRPPGTLASAYTRQAPPTEKMFGVYVTHVHTPSCLCVQIIGETTTRTLEYLLEDLTQFYNSRGGDSYVLKKPIIGQPCCTLFSNDGYWYRAEVVGMPTSDITEVLYVDYGNTGRVPATSLRKPKPHYMTLPAQAIKCRLAHLKPAGSRWSRQASSLLFQMTKDKPIVAIVTSVVDGLISVTLCDTTTEEDIHINDTLVSQGLAIFIKDTEEEERKYDGYQPEPLPLGATENIPDVHIPSSKVETSPTATPSPTSTTITSLPTLLTLTNHTLPTPSVIPTPTALPTPPPTPAPPGLTTPQITAPLMQNYLLNLLLQQAACVPNMAGLPPSSLAQLLTGQSGFNFLFAAPRLETAVNPAVAPNPAVTPQPAVTTQQVVTPKRPQTSSACNHDPVTPVDSVRPLPPFNSLSSDSTEQAPPTSHTPTNNKPAPETEREKEEEKEERKPSNLPKMRIKKWQLTKDRGLHVIQYNSRAYILSPQVSEWFWDTDLLQSMLRQVQNARPVWGLMLQEHRAKDLFREMKRDPQLRALLYGRCEVTIYALEDLPTIVSVFHAPSPVCAAVKMESEQWLKKGLDYFTDPVCELNAVTTELDKLRSKRKEILSSLEVDGGGEGEIDEGIQSLTKVTKAISKLKAEQAMLVGALSTGGNVDDHQDAGHPPSSLSMASLDHSESGRVASQACDFDEPFYTCASSQSTPTPTPEPPDLTASQALPTYPETSAACLSPINLSPSSSLSSLSDDALSRPPHLPQGPTTRDTNTEREWSAPRMPYLTDASSGRDTPQEVREEMPVQRDDAVTVGNLGPEKRSEPLAHNFRNVRKPRRLPLQDDIPGDAKPSTPGKQSVEVSSPTKSPAWKSPLSAFRFDSAGPSYSPVSDVPVGRSSTAPTSTIWREVRQQVSAEPMCTPAGLHRTFRPGGSERVPLSSGCGQDTTGQSGSTGFTRGLRDRTGSTGSNPDRTCNSGGVEGSSGPDRIGHSGLTGFTASQQDRSRSGSTGFTGRAQGRTSYPGSMHGRTGSTGFTGDRTGVGRWGSSGQRSTKRRRGGRGNLRNRPASRPNQPETRKTGSGLQSNKEAAKYSERRSVMEEDAINCSSSEGLSSPSELVPHISLGSHLHGDSWSLEQSCVGGDDPRATEKSRIPPARHEGLDIEWETWDIEPVKGGGVTQGGGDDEGGRGEEEVEGEKGGEGGKGGEKVGVLEAKTSEDLIQGRFAGGGLGGEEAQRTRFQQEISDAVIGWEVAVEGEKESGGGNENEEQVCAEEGVSDERLAAAGGERSDGVLEGVFALEQVEQQTQHVAEEEWVEDVPQLETVETKVSDIAELAVVGGDGGQTESVAEVEKAAETEKAADGALEEGPGDVAEVRASADEACNEELTLIWEGSEKMASASVGNEVASSDEARNVECDGGIESIDNEKPERDTSDEASKAEGSTAELNVIAEADLETRDDGLEMERNAQNNDEGTAQKEDGEGTEVEVSLVEAELTIDAEDDGEEAETGKDDGEEKATVGEMEERPQLNGAEDVEIETYCDQINLTVVAGDGGEREETSGVDEGKMREESTAFSEIDGGVRGEERVTSDVDGGGVEAVSEVNQEEGETWKVDEGEREEEDGAIEEKTHLNVKADGGIGDKTSSTDSTLVAEDDNIIGADETPDTEEIKPETEQECKEELVDDSNGPGNAELEGVVDDRNGPGNAELEGVVDDRNGPGNAELAVIVEEEEGSAYQEKVDQSKDEADNESELTDVGEEDDREVEKTEQSLDHNDPSIDLDSELAVEGSDEEEFVAQKTNEVAAEKVEEVCEEVTMVSTGFELSGLEEWCKKMEERGTAQTQTKLTENNGEVGSVLVLDARGNGTVGKSDLLVDLSLPGPVNEDKSEDNEDTSTWPSNILPLENAATNTRGNEQAGAVGQHRKIDEGPQSTVNSKASDGKNTEPSLTHPPPSPPKHKPVTSPSSLTVTAAFKPKYPLSAPLPALIPTSPPSSAPPKSTTATPNHSSSLKVTEEFVPAYPHSSLLPPLPSHSPSPYISPPRPPADSSLPLSLPLIPSPSPSPSILSPPSPSLPLVYPLPSSQPQPFIPETVELRIPPPFYRPTSVEWASERLIGLGRGTPENNPRAFMLPGYPECQPYRPERIVYNLVGPTPRHCPGTWQVLESQPR